MIVLVWLLLVVVVVVFGGGGGGGGDVVLVVVLFLVVVVVVRAAAGGADMASNLSTSLSVISVGGRCKVTRSKATSQQTSIVFPLGPTAVSKRNCRPALILCCWARFRLALYAALFESVDPLEEYIPSDSLEPTESKEVVRRGSTSMGAMDGEGGGGSTI